MILSCHNIGKSFGTETVLKDVSFHINEYEKAAIVGINGAGKSTLLRMITGELSPDIGTVTLAKNKTLGYLAQHQDLSAERTIYEEVLEGKRELLDMEARLQEMEKQMEHLSSEQLEAHMNAYHQLLHIFDSRNGFGLRSEVNGVLKGLGFDESEFDKNCDALSGGQKTRVSLARLLVTHPDIILLDEPTNHLDIESISWLENFLLNYKGTVVIVAHDRYFLDRIVSKVIAVSLHRAEVYTGNYSEYAKKAAERRAEYLHAYENQQREIKHQEEVIVKLRQFNREKSIKRAESREKQLEKMEVLEKPQAEHSAMQIRLTPSVISGNDVLTVENISKSFHRQTLFSGIEFSLKRGERVALIGQNGTGKTTILKIINEVYMPDTGTIRLGSNVIIGYYDQEQQNLDGNKTIFDEISDDYPTLTISKIRNVLAAFLFTGEDVYKRVSDLSGGERGRVALAKLMLSDANFLILDEPTNHLDMESKEILEEALNAYEGTVFFVSHDRYFINKVATRVLNLHHHIITNYLGNYDYYIEKREELEGESHVSVAEFKEEGLESAGKDAWEATKEKQAKERKKQKRILFLEQEIEELEAKIALLDEEFLNPDYAFNSVKLQELTKERENLDKQLSLDYSEWEDLLL